MLKYVLVVILAVAAPAAVFAQSTKSPGETAGSNTGTSAGSSSAAQPGATGNLNNPQAEANQAGQPGNARTTPGSDSATQIPTPTLPGSTMKTIPQPSRP